MSESPALSPWPAMPRYDDQTIFGQPCQVTIGIIYALYNVSVVQRLTLCQRVPLFVSALI